MNKKDELAKFILENPSLPLVFFISGEDILDEYSSTVHEDFSFRRATVYLCINKIGSICAFYFSPQKRCFTPAVQCILNMCSSTNLKQG